MDKSQADGESNNEGFIYLQETIDNPATAIVQQQISGNEVKMLVESPSGDQRLITFDIPFDECTVQDLLKYVNISPNGRTVYLITNDKTWNINYVVESSKSPFLVQPKLSTSSPKYGNNSQSTVRKMPYSKYPPIKSNQMDKLQADGESNSENFAYLQKTIDNPATAIVQRQINGNVVKMLVNSSSDGQRLITFDIPTDECTVQDLLKQANIPSNGRIVVSLVTNKMLNINYIVETITAPFLVQPKALTNNPECHDNSQPTVHEEPRFINNRLAVCPYCEYSSIDFNRCASCQRKLPNDVEQVEKTIKTRRKMKAMIYICKYYRRQCKHKDKFEEAKCVTLPSDEKNDQPEKQ